MPEMGIFKNRLAPVRRAVEWWLHDEGRPTVSPDRYRTSSVFAVSAIGSMGTTPSHARGRRSAYCGSASARLARRRKCSTTNPSSVVNKSQGRVRFRAAVLDDGFSRSTLHAMAAGKAGQFDRRLRAKYRLRHGARVPPSLPPHGQLCSRRTRRASPSSARTADRRAAGRIGGAHGGRRAPTRVDNQWPLTGASAAQDCSDFWPFR